jgi:hypothetical protein
MPMMAFIGVRISWLMLARKAALHPGRFFGQLLGALHRVGSFALLGHVLEHPYRSLRQLRGIDRTAADSAPETRAVLALQFHHRLTISPRSSVAIGHRGGLPGYLVLGQAQPGSPDRSVHRES